MIVVETRSDTAEQASGRAESARFVREAHRLVRDLMAANMPRYWTDFLITTCVVYVSFALYISSRGFSVVHLLAFLVCGLAMFRAVVFTHEITHRRNPPFRRFAVVWNLLCGIPFLMPSFMYGNHYGHHTTDAYGTWSDPEYILHGRSWRLKATAFLFLPVIYPILILLRFLVLAPLALISRRIDRFVWRYGSSLYVMNESYRREFSSAATSSSRWAQEVACAAWAWTIAILSVTGHVSVGTLRRTYLVFLFWIAVNQIRTLAAHRYTNDVNSPVSHLRQLLDTNTFPYGKWLPELWAPVGLRYHALHHLLPLMPYHAMGAAHDRLMQCLPAGSPYHRTVRQGLWSVLVSLLLERKSPPTHGGRRSEDPLEHPQEVR